MGHTIDLVGKEFGRLVVFSKTKRRDVCGNVLWECRCSCGNTIDVRTSSLKNGHCQSCGCLNREVNFQRIFRDLSGQRFGMLSVIKLAGQNVRGKSIWLCKCDCGNIKKIAGNSLVSGATVSCGCYHIQVVSSMRGEKHYKWRGGFSSKDYPIEWNHSLKECIRNRDNRKCQYPNCEYDDTKEMQKLSVHHIDGNKKNCYHTNLISLCNRHHQVVENNHPEVWAEMFYTYTESFVM